MAKKKQEERFVTIGEYYKEFLENKTCRVIKFYLREAWGKSKTQDARVKIYLPNEICGSDVRDLRKWHLSIIAIPLSEIEKLNEKERKEKEGKNKNGESGNR